LKLSTTFCLPPAIYAVYSLGFTLILGLVGWVIPHLLKWRALSAYASVGALLGLLAAGLFVTGGFNRGNPFLISWPLPELWRPSHFVRCSTEPFALEYRVRLRPKKRMQLAARHSRET
jgi:hypothetical protein